LRSIRSTSRARTGERGFALLAAIILAALYFGLMELLLIDSARELREAQRFRARVVAETLAENGAELAAADLINRSSSTASAEDWQGRIGGRMNKTGPVFRIEAQGIATGVVRQEATVSIQGRINGNRISIEYADHSW
jgi:hypothetical protein